MSESMIVVLVVICIVANIGSFYFWAHFDLTRNWSYLSVICWVIGFLATAFMMAIYAVDNILDALNRVKIIGWLTKDRSRK
ncbi:TMhelix containing protein [Vibrio phage 1.081.O._10N.286.52.C2]|nr:TMhelix containing protein [Vibrio phage 1.081.O._10N.286.52.C2]